MTTLMDDWLPSASLDMIKLRADLLAQLRVFFSARAVLEVDTPALSTAANPEPHLEAFVALHGKPGLGKDQGLYLQTSPELPMKRLLAAGSGSIYQIAKVFRNGELGRYHNPEFTLLEWYRVGFDHQQLMDEVAELVTMLLAKEALSEPVERLNYGDVFQHYLGLDPYRSRVKELMACASAQGFHPPPGMPMDDPNPWLDLLLSHFIEPHLGRKRLTFIYDYPATQAALAKIRPGNPPVAERFELYVQGIELANGFHELTDADEQYRRLQANNRRRMAQGLPSLPVDNRFLAALKNGLPDCAGVALGLDRLLMIMAGKSTLQDVMAFPIQRA
jgi:lysyl-tRNA synthetase class 2